MWSSIQAALTRQEFDPGILGLFINPFYFARKGLRENIAPIAASLSGRLLDVGCGSKPYKLYFNTSEYVGLEIEGRNKVADCHYDGKAFPFENAEFDAVFTSQVLEHVFNPEQFLQEIHRVLKDGGAFLLTVPFVWDEHEQPYDYARYTSFGLSHLLTTNGFEIVRQQKSVSDIRASFQMINSYMYRMISTPSYKINLLLTMLLIAPVNILGEFLAWVLPTNSDFYLDSIVLARKIPHNKQSVVSGSR